MKSLLFKKILFQVIRLSFVALITLLTLLFFLLLAKLINLDKTSLIILVLFTSIWLNFSLSTLTLHPQRKAKLKEQQKIIGFGLLLIAVLGLTNYVWLLTAIGLFLILTSFKKT